MASGEPRFLNVDLDLESVSPLGSLVDALPSMMIMFSARMGRKYVLSMELASAALPVDQTLRRMAKTISRLTGQPRRLWQPLRVLPQRHRHR